jgi:arabinofuranan 3-O-arabinosyltransferase
LSIDTLSGEDLITDPEEADAEPVKRTEGSDPHRGPLHRWVLAAIAAGFLVLTFTQASGSIEDDSKLPTLLSPLTFISSTLHLWNSQLYGGTVNLNVGFDLPLGFFFAITHLLHIPTWCAERIWLALLLTAGCWGVVRLSEALGIGNRWGRVIAGLAYTVAPIVFTWTTASVALLAVVLLPWIILPLVVGSKEGSPGRAAARSGVAVALIGGANAAVVVAILPMAVIWLLTRTPGKRRRALMGWWVIALGAACFWWVAGTALVGKYGYNYLPYTETSALTTSTTSAFESIRGASFWVDYFHVNGALLPGAWILVSDSLVIVGTTVVAALGLGGLCRRIPERLFLITSLAVGVLVIAAGYSGSVGGLFSHHVQDLLQGSLAPIRNVSKFSPDVALPLALGLAATLSLAPLGEVGRSLRRAAPRAKAMGGAVAVVTVAAIVIAAAPYWRQSIYPPSGFAAIPHYWTQAGAWLDTHQGNQNALLVPGAKFAYYTWGDPVDEPLEVLSDKSVEERNLVPAGSNGAIQQLDALEQALDDGTTVPGLSQFLAREGIKYLVERNDLNIPATGAPPPAEVHQVLSETPGLKEVASFGPILPATQVEFGSLPVYNSPTYLQLRPVDIFRVEASTSVVQTYPVTDPVVVSGDAGSLLPLAGAGDVAGRATVLAGDPLAKGAANAKQATWAISDGNQRRYLSFGGIRYNQSYLLTGQQKLPGAPTDVPAAFSVVDGVAHQTVEAPVGALSVSASSYGSSALVDDPEDGPAAAFDGNTTTAWVAHSAHRSIGQWVSITFGQPRDLSTIAVTPLVGPVQQPTVSRITITTDRGSVSRSLPAVKSRVVLSVPHGESRHLKITITDVRPAPPVPNGGIILGAGITDVAIPGVTFLPQMKVPDDESSSFSAAGRNPPDIVFNRPIEDTNLTLGKTNTDDPSMGREFSVPQDMSAKVTGYAVPRPDETLQQLLEYLTAGTSSSLKVTASSWLGDLPLFRPENLVGNSGSPWIAGVGDKKPSLDFTWGGQMRQINSISVTPSLAAAPPTKISITGSSGTRRLANVPPKGGVIDFPSILTDSLRVQFVSVKSEITVSPSTDVESPLPVGLSNVTIPALHTPVVGPIDKATAVSLPCGQGPSITVDGQSIATSLSGNLGDLVDLKPMPMVACLPAGGMRLARGTHSFSAGDSVHPFEVTSITMKALGVPSTPSVAAPRTSKVETWGDVTRTIRVSAGPATYLAVAQNYNTAWTAKLGNQTLKPVRLDGWQQGYIIPAGQAAVVTMHIAPDRIFRWLLLLGAVLLVALVAAALFPWRSRIKDKSGPRSTPSRWVLFAGALVVLVVISGPLALVVVPLVIVARRWGNRVMAVTAFGAFVAAGAVAAWDPAVSGSQGAGAFSGAAQILSVVALAAVLVTLILDGKGWRTRHGEHVGG